MAGMLGKLWDDVAGGSAPDQGLNQLRKSTSGNARQFPDVSSDTLRNRERRFSTGTYDSPEGSPASRNIAISKSPNVGTLDVNEPVSGSPSSLGSTPPTSPFMAGSPSSTYSRGKITYGEVCFTRVSIQRCARSGRTNSTRRRRMRRPCMTGCTATRPSRSTGK